MDSGLKDKVVVVTGASGGIGSAIARQFAREGACVVVHYHRGAVRAAVLEKELGANCRALPADLTDERQVKRLFRQAIKAFGRVDSVIANGAAWETQDVPLHKMPLRQWRQTLDGVLTSAFLTLREFMRLVERQHQGNAVLIASTAAVFGEAGHADYAAAKAGLAYGLTRSLKNELGRLAPHTRNYCGGRINCICPGWTIVPRLAAKLGDHQTIRKVAATMALPQLARPDDIAHAALFLASDKLARHLTGQILVIAGGMEGRRLWNPDEIDPSAV